MRPVFSALDANDVRGAAIGGEQIGALGAGEQPGHRAGAGQQPDDVVVRARCKHCRQHVVPRPLGAKLHA